jgi:sugar phosphate permease
MCFFLLAIPGAVAIWLLVRYVADKPEIMLARGRLSQEEYDFIKAGLVEEDESSEAAPKVTYSVLLKDKYFWLYTLQLFMTLAVYWGSTTWISSFLYEQHGLSLRSMGLMASMPYAVAFFSTILGGWLMDKVFHRTKPVALISYVCAIPILYYIGQVELGNHTMLIIMLFLTGAFVNMIWGVIYAYPQVRYPKHVVGLAAGLSNGLGQMGAFLSPLVAGFLVYRDEAGVAHYDNVFIMFAVCSLIAALAVCFLDEKTYKLEDKN